jgi:aquaporin TIP
MTVSLLAKQGMVEAIATFILIFVGAGSIIANQQTGGASGLTGIALAHGFAIFVGVSATGHISGGHINPAVTIAFLITGRIKIEKAAVYIAAQLAGATIAALALLVVTAQEDRDAVSLGTPLLAGSVDLGAGIAIEAVLTFFLVFVIFQTAGHPRGPVVAPLAIGGTIMIDILIGGPLTGAAMNPARAFGPALVGGYFNVDHVAYWIGPILGGSLAALLSHYVIQRGGDEEEA